jgi:AAA domain
MKLHQVQHGEIVTLVVSPESGRLSAPVATEQEVRLIFSRTGSEILLAREGAADVVQSSDDVTRRRLDTLRQLDPPRLCWVVAQRDRNGCPELTLQAHRFHSSVRWTDEIALGVDERAVERVSQMAGRRMAAEEACQWLAEQLLLPATDAAGYPRAIATGAPDENRRFRLLGARVAVDITPHDEALRVERVVALHARAKGFRPPEFLVEARLAFADATVTGAVRRSIRSQLDRIVAEAGSYLALWERYQGIEREQLSRRVRELGSVRYSAFEMSQAGFWKFRASDRKQLEQLQHRLGDSELEELEAASELPAELLEGAPAGAHAANRGSARAPVGTVERIDLEQCELVLRPIDEDSDVLPPRKGVVFAALQGDRKRLARREDALRRLRSADARIPQLGLILEGQDASIRRTDTLQPLSAAVRKVFGHEPTQKQQEAIYIALNTPDIAVIQGPPGTGKTKVITAIQARLAEIQATHPEISGRTLLTSYQHDAVDHAAGKSVVFGIPAARFGGRRGEHARDAQVERWAAYAYSHVESVLGSLADARPLSLYRSMRDRVASYAAGRMSAEEVRDLLDELIALPAGHLPTELWAELRRLRSVPATLATAGEDELERELMRKAVRGLRTTAQAFADDGPRRAHQVLQRMGDGLSDDERRLLQSAAEVEPGGTFAHLADLAALRDALLDRWSADQVPGDRPRVDRGMLEALKRVVAALHMHMQGSESGVADALQEYADALRMDPRGVERLVQQYSAVYAATCQQAVSHHVVSARGGESQDLAFENVIVDEAARANPLDLFIPMSLAKRRILLVGDHRQLPHLLDTEIERELTESVNEATQKALSDSLFQRLFEDLGARERRDGFPRVVTLNQQYRMHPTLGQFISDVFYVPHQEGFSSPRPASDFAHEIPGYLRAGHPVCAAWKDIPNHMGAEHRGRSKARPAEARWIAREVRRLLVEVRAEVSIGIITFYRAQVDLLLEALVHEGIAERDPDSGAIEILPEWRTLERKDRSREERMCVGTVDAFQGKEFDIVFLSVTRSNTIPAETDDDYRRKFGHLVVANRLCVAMSRQRQLLVAVGDQAMFRTDAARAAVPGLTRFLDLCGGEDGLVV